MLLLLVVLLCRFITLAQTVLNTEILLLDDLRLVAKVQQDAFNLHVSDFSEYPSCSLIFAPFQHSLLSFLLLLLVVLLCRFITLAQTVLNTEILLLDDLRLVAKVQQDAFNLHVSDFSEYPSCSLIFAPFQHSI